MVWNYILAIAPLLIAAAIAMTLWVRRVGAAVVPKSVRVATVVAVLVPSLILILILIMLAVASSPVGVLAGWSSEFLISLVELRFLLPLTGGVFALVVLAWPSRANRGGGSAELSRRTPFTFASPVSLAWILFAVVVSVVLAIIAGVASAPDDAGRYTMFFIEVGTMSAGTTIYGWYFSVPCVVLLAVLLLVMLLDLWLISRPPLSSDRDRDVAVRKIRALNVTRVAAGAVLFHLSAVLTSLAATSTLQVGLPTSTAGDVTVGSPFAAFTVVLFVAASAVTTLGLVFWISTLLSTLTRPVRVRRAESARA